MVNLSNAPFFFLLPSQTMLIFFIRLATSQKTSHPALFFLLFFVNRPTFWQGPLRVGLSPPNPFGQLRVDSPPTLPPPLFPLTPPKSCLLLPFFFFLAWGDCRTFCGDGRDFFFSLGSPDNQGLFFSSPPLTTFFDRQNTSAPNLFFPFSLSTPRFVFSLPPISQASDRFSPLAFLFPPAAVVRPVEFRPSLTPRLPDNDAHAFSVVASLAFVATPLFSCDTFCHLRAFRKPV